MRTFLIFFFACLPFWLSSQNTQNELGFLVKKDSVSFYSFGKEGVFEYLISSSKELQKTYTKYSSGLPTELKNIEFISLSALVSETNEVYFLYPGGGILFKYCDGVFERIDESFAHRNQFSGHFFEYKKELYLLGGYGYWRSNSLLTKYNFSSKSWEIVPTNGQAPPLGVNAGSYVLDKNNLYVFDFYHRIDDKDTKNNNLFKLNLDGFVWEKKGALNSGFYDAILIKNFEIIAPFKNSLFQQNLNGNNIRIITPSENKLDFYNAESLPNINDKVIIVGSNIVYPILSADRKYQTITVKDLENLTLIDEQYFTNDFNLFKNYFLYVALFCGLLIFLTFIKFKKEKFVFFISENNLSGMNHSIQISKDEKFIIQLISLSKNKKVDNSLILNYFKNNNVSLDASVKRKNKVVDELNRKFLDSFKLVLVLKSVKKSDSRQAVYSLNPVIDI